MGRGSGRRCHSFRERGQSCPRCSRLLAAGRGREGRGGEGDRGCEAWEEGTGLGPQRPQQPQGAQGPAQQRAEVPVACGPCA